MTTTIAHAKSQQLSVRRSRLQLLLHDYIAAERFQNHRERIQNRNAMLEAIGAFKATDDPHPTWCMPMMQAMILAAQAGVDLPHDKTLEQAIQLEQQALDYANSLLATAPDDKAAKNLAARNERSLSIYLRKLRRFADAVPRAERARDLWPENDAMVINLAIALSRAGHEQQASDMLNKLIASEGTHTLSFSRAFALHDKEFRAELAELPVARQLIDLVESEEVEQDETSCGPA